MKTDFGRVVGIDYGEKRLGVAISDPLGLTAQPVATVEKRGDRGLLAIAELAREKNAVRIVIGLPKHMNGDEGEKAQAARAFGDQLAATSGLPVDYVDERLTTVAVQRMLSETAMSGGKKRRVVDKLAAVLILQMWLDREQRKPPPQPEN